MEHTVYIVFAQIISPFTDYAPYIVSVHTTMEGAYKKKILAQRRADRLRRVRDGCLRMISNPKKYRRRHPEGRVYLFTGTRYFDSMLDTQEGCNPYDPYASMYGYDTHYSITSHTLVD